MMVLLLSGCSKNGEDPVDIPTDDFDNSGEKTVVYRGKENFPLSFTVDGAQKIENGTYWYYELADTYEKNWEEPFYVYDNKKMELSGSKNYGKLVKEKCFATNGNWPLFLNPVHTEYTASNQEMVDKTLVNLAGQQLSANQMESASLIITDTWICDMNGDGSQETIFKACNCGAEDENGKYCFIAYANAESCQVLYSTFRADGSEGPEKLSPMVCDLDGDGKWALLLYRKGDYESFTSFDFSGGNFTKCYEIIF